MKFSFQTKLLATLFLAVFVAGAAYLNVKAVNDSIYAVTPTTATVGTAVNNLEIEYTVDTASQTWVENDTLTVQLPPNVPQWSSLTFTAEYDTDVANDGAGEVGIAQGTDPGQYVLTDDTITIKWKTAWGAPIDAASTVRILVTAGLTPMYADDTSGFVFAGTTADGTDANPTATVDVNISAADPGASIDITGIDTVGETGSAVITFDIDHAIVDNDQVWITFPVNFDITNAAYGSDTFTGNFDTCADAGQILKCDANGGIAAQGAGTLTISGIKAKYAAAAGNITTAVYDVSATANISTASDAIAATYAATTLTADPDASATATVGDTSGTFSSTLTFPVALETNDTIKFTFPANYDVSGLTTGAGQNFALDANVTVGVASQVVTLTLSAAQTTLSETINFEANKVLAKYATSTESVLILIFKKSTGVAGRPRLPIADEVSLS